MFAGSRTQGFSYSYLLFKELAAIKDQAGAHAYAG